MEDKYLAKPKKLNFFQRFRLKHFLSKQDNLRKISESSIQSAPDYIKNSKEVIELILKKYEEQKNAVVNKWTEDKVVEGDLIRLLSYVNNDYYFVEVLDEKQKGDETQ